MRAVTLINLAAVQDPVVRSALDEIQKASQDNVISDVAQSGAALSTIENAAADEFPYFTSATTVDLTALTAFSRSMLALGTEGDWLTALGGAPSGSYLVSTNDLSDVANAATARGNLGLGSAATHAAGDFLETANNLSDVPLPATARGNLGAAAQTQTDFISGGIKIPANQDYHIIEKIPFGATLTSFTAKLSSGTCTATLKINSTAVTGGAINATSSQQSASLTAANVMSANDTLVITISSVSSPTDFSFTVVFTETLA